MAGDYVVLLWGCSTMSCMPSSMASGSVLTTRCPAPFRSTATGLSSAARQTSARLVSDLADQLGLPIAALSGEDVRLEPGSADSTLPIQPFVSSPRNPALRLLAIAEELAMPLAKLSMDDRAFIDQVLSETLATD